MSLAALPLELHQHIARFLTEADAKVHLSHLAQTCQAFAAIYQPLLYSDLRLNRVARGLLPATYAILTKRMLALAVDRIEFPDLALAPSPQEWPPYVDHQRLRDWVEETLSDEPRETIDTCARLVSEGMREDLIAMLLLTRTPNLDALVLRAVSTRSDDTLARTIFRYATMQLIRVMSVSIAEEPQPGELPARDDEEDLSYAYFADLLRLPKVVTIVARKFGPTNVQRPFWELLGAYFHPIEFLDTENRSIQWLELSEHFATMHSHLANLLKRLHALEWLEFLRADNDNGKWGTSWGLDEFQAALELRAETLSALTLSDILDHGNYEDWGRDPRSRISLCALLKLTHIDLDGVWVFHHAGESESSPIYNAETDPLRLVTMLPSSVQDLTIRINSEWPEEFHTAMISALLTLIKKHQDENDFPAFSFLSLVIYPRRYTQQYSEAIRAAEAAGLKVQALASKSRQGAEKREQTPWERWCPPDKQRD